MVSLFHSFGVSALSKNANMYQLGKWAKMEHTRNDILNQLRKRKLYMKIKNQEPIESRTTSTMVIAEIRSRFNDCYLPKYGKNLRLIGFQFINFVDKKLYNKDKLYKDQWHVYLVEATRLVYNCEMELHGYYIESIVCAISADYKIIIATLKAIYGSNWRVGMPHPSRLLAPKHRFTFWQCDKGSLTDSINKKYGARPNFRLMNWGTNKKYKIPLRIQRSCNNFRFRRYNVESPQSCTDSSSEADEQ